MHSYPVNISTGQVFKSSLSVRDAVLTAYAIEQGNFDSDTYEHRYGKEIQLDVSYLTAMCIWRLGSWKAYDVVLSHA